MKFGKRTLRLLPLGRNLATENKYRFSQVQEKRQPYVKQGSLRTNLRVSNDFRVSEFKKKTTQLTTAPGGGQSEVPQSILHLPSGICPKI